MWHVIFPRSEARVPRRAVFLSCLPLVDCPSSQVLPTHTSAEAIATPTNTPGRFLGLRLVTRPSIRRRGSPLSLCGLVTKAQTAVKCVALTALLLQVKTH